MKLNRTLIGFIRKEFRQTLRDKRMRVLLFLSPVVQLTLFGVALSNEVKNVRLAASFPPSDQVMRDVYQRSLGSRWFIPAKVTGLDPSGWVHSGQADAVLIAPPGGVTRSIGRQEGQVQLIVNAQNVLRAIAIESYVRTVIREVTTDPASESQPPLHFDARILYNPTLETSVYMVPGVMSMLVCLITIVLTSMSLARERELGTFEMLIAAPVRPWEVVIGKTLPFVVLGMVDIPLILVAGIVLFQLPVRGPVVLILVSGLFFVMNTVSIGTLISTLARNQQQAMLGGFLFLFPAILLSGLMFPIENMPLLLRGLAYANPLTHYMAILRNVMLKGGSLSFVAMHTAVLAGIAVVMVFFSFRRFHTTLT